VVLPAVYHARGAHFTILHSFSLSLPWQLRRHDNFSHKLFRLDSRRSSSIFFAETAIETAAGTTCVNCETDTTSGQWFNCKYTGTKLCTPCYNKNRLDVAAAAGTCVKSGTDTTVVSGTAAKTSPKVKFA
jgi:predicted sulfurtransferase